MGPAANLAEPCGFAGSWHPGWKAYIGDDSGPSMPAGYPGTGPAAKASPRRHSRQFQHPGGEAGAPRAGTGPCSPTVMLPPGGDSGQTSVPSTAPVPPGQNDTVGPEGTMAEILGPREPTLSSPATVPWGVRLLCPREDPWLVVDALVDKHPSSPHPSAAFVHHLLASPYRGREGWMDTPRAVPFRVCPPVHLGWTELVDKGGGQALAGSCGAGKASLRALPARLALQPIASATARTVSWGWSSQ